MLVERGLENIAAEPALRIRGFDLQQPLGLGIEEADAARLVDRIDALHDTTQDGLGLRLPPPQLAGQLNQVAAHLLHGRGQHADLLAAGHRDCRRQVPGTEPAGGIRQPLDIGDPVAPDEQRCRDGEHAGEHSHTEDPLGHPGDSPHDLVQRQAGMHYRNGLARHRHDGLARSIHTVRRQARRDGFAARDGAGIEDIEGIGAVPTGEKINDFDTESRVLAQAQRKTRIQRPNRHHRDIIVTGRTCARAVQCVARQGTGHQEAVALFGRGRQHEVPVDVLANDRKRPVVPDDDAAAESGALAVARQVVGQRIRSSQAQQAVKRRTFAQHANCDHQFLDALPYALASGGQAELHPRQRLGVGQALHRADPEQRDGQDRQGNQQDRDQREAPGQSGFTETHSRE